jgi:ATP-dependent RNA circularization protein (DNA/RNA ligase family)
MEYVKIPNIFKREEFAKNRLIEGQYSTPELEYLKDAMWVWTEKVDGTNVRVIWDGYRVSFAGRTDNAQLPPHLLKRLEELFGGPDKEELFEQNFGDNHVILFGEGYGEKIQKGGGLYGPVDFILFDVFCGMYLKQEDVLDIAIKFGLLAVPVVGSGGLEEAVEYIRSHPKSMLREAELEGIVCRPMVELNDRRGNRIIVKIKCRDFPAE